MSRCYFSLSIITMANGWQYSFYITCCYSNGVIVKDSTLLPMEVLHGKFMWGMVKKIMLLPGVVTLEEGVLLSPFSSSKGFLGCSSCNPPRKKSDCNQWLQSCSSRDRGELRACWAACNPSSSPRVLSASISGEEAVLVSINWMMSFSGWKKWKSHLIISVI